MSASKRLKRLRRRELTDSSTRLANSSRTCVRRSAMCSGSASLYGLKMRRTSAPSSAAAENSAALRGDGEVEAFAVGQDAVARVEPERVRRVGLDGRR